MPQYLSPGVYIEELEPSSRPIEGVSTSIAAFVGIAPQGPFNTPTLVTNWSQYVATFGDFSDAGYLDDAVYGFFNNGGSIAYVVRIGDGDNDEGAAPQGQLPAGATAALPGPEGKSAYRVSALDPAAENISVEVHDASEGDQGEVFKLLVKRGDEVVETFDNLTSKRGRQNAVTVVNQQSKTVKLELAQPGAELRPTGGQTALAKPAAAATPEPMNDPITPAQYIGDSADRTGFMGLEAVEEITMVAIPDLRYALETGALDLEGYKAVQLALISHCELMGNRMAILDAPAGMNAQQVKDWRLNQAGYDSKYAALYWPSIKVFDPASGRNKFVPPSGHVAGLWCRTDSERGVHKAPANEIVRGAVDLEVNITRAEHDLLNPQGINVIRSFPGRGVRVWGARTLSSDAAWRYINVRRLFNYVESSILANTDWVVFEPNDQELWGRIRRTINAFLYNVWLSGALFGATPQQAFYVKCDDETNPSEVIESGRVVTEIGISPVKPAEFVVFRLAQMPSGISALTE